ncbi:exodeoxyribonuclease VII large subunit [Granulicatella elegans]|uniref:Exodeoxyribonuclease 7 large subunit n=1 Tax=Granulicatella elegans ATCC 700633 TaxID=626369 RepID=D0BJY9_9LACT|nr:exodeoxyribonuclease VII large subunit [Granulicatella elegans]EEW93392.1 exodeoxyribonuclease VII, large subunit [Granulicatella elegans ATCC 700633]
MSEEYVTVSALTKYIKYKFDKDPHLGRVYLTGEISNFRLRPTHQYFSLKDENAIISATMFQSAFKKIQFRPEEGMKVLVIGKVSVFEKSGQYQINIEHMEPDGVGALYLAYEQLKKKLEAEGLFSLPKKPIPQFPKKIAILTSESGAVIQDIQTTVARRFPIVQLVLYPTVVQGVHAVNSILKNLDLVEKEDYDVVIIGRGGGSIEDLWAFNEEPVVRRVAELSIPVISSVGHETDTTLIDFVSDMRAATPTAAAEIATPVLMEIHQQLRNLQTRLEQALSRQLQIKRERMQALANASIFQNPERIYQVYQQRVDQLEMRLQQMMQQSVQHKRQQLVKNQHRLELGSPSRRVQTEKQALQYLAKRLEQAQGQLMKDKKQQFQRAIQQLDLLSPLKIMNRGYGILQQEETIIKSVDQLEVNQELTIQLVDGTVRSKVTSVEKGNQLW